MRSQGQTTHKLAPSPKHFHAAPANQSTLHGTNFAVPTPRLPYHLPMSFSVLAFNSVQNAMASAYAQTRTSSTPRTAPVAEIVPIRSAASGSTALATGLGTLLTHLSAGNLESSRTALAAFSSQIASADTTSALPALAARLTTRLTAGSTAGALADIQSFLLNANRTTGTGFSATV